MDLSVLNQEQKAAVTAGSGPVLVLAGAGSGKTRVLTYRIAYLIEQKLFPPEHILAVTFTNKAAKEMQSRVVKLLGSAYSSKNLPTLKTFHSLGAMILRREIAVLGYGNNFTILDDDDQLKLIKEIVKGQEVNEKFAPSFFRASISKAKNLAQTPDELNLGYETFVEDLVRSVYAQYQNQLFKQNSVDFDDLLMLPYRIFSLRPDVLKRYQERFRYVLVDEYQDTNRIQYEFLMQLTPTSNLFVVGDDAQSIYGFRGSNIRNILDFEKDFPNVAVFKLEENYRSTGNILATAQNVIELNTEQKKKKLWTKSSLGPPVWLEATENERTEGAFVVKKIVELAVGKELPEEIVYEEDITQKPFSILDLYMKQGRVQQPAAVLPAVHGPLSDFAILFRTHAQSRALEEALILAGIPYQIVGGVKFYERREIKDVLAYLRLLQNNKDTVSLKRVINVPPRGLGEKSVEAVLSGKPLTERAQRAVDAFFAEFSYIETLEAGRKLSEIVELLIKRLGLKEYFQDRTEAGEQRLENLKELVGVVGNFDHLPWREALTQFLEEVILITDIDTLEGQKDAVTLMTLHAVKGLEFDYVFFVGLEEGLLPHSRSLLDPTELAEEIRLAYVGLTRARKRLFLIYARARRIYGDVQGSVPSRIIKALPPANVKYNGVDASVFAGEELSYEYEN